ncbi:hypothetical protein HDU98_000855 [Podochytrium sp. JEL0797]|nr:hypothetical protein HDU98_000855 [Podochytrium sp. JEL0797]
MSDSSANSPPPPGLSPAEMYNSLLLIALFGLLVCLCMYYSRLCRRARESADASDQEMFLVAARETQRLEREPDRSPTLPAYTLTMRQPATMPPPYPETQIETGEQDSEEESGGHEFEGHRLDVVACASPVTEQGVLERF